MMTALPKRKRTRLEGFDYTSSNMYFVTICTQGKRCFFGKIVNEEMELNWKGKIIEACWTNLPNHYPHIELDTFVVMPNHFHGIISIIDNVGDDFKSSRSGNDKSRMNPADLKPATHKNSTVGDGSPVPNNLRGQETEKASTVSDRETLSLRKPSLSQFIAYFKYMTTKKINQKLNTPGHKLWQRSFYDHIIRDDDDYRNTQAYIEMNPAKWEWDKENRNAGMNA